MSFAGAAISNIAWPAEDDAEALDLVQAAGFAGNRIGSCQVVRPMGGYSAATGPHRGGGSCRARTQGDCTARPAV